MDIRTVFWITRLRCVDNDPLRCVCILRCADYDINNINYATCTPLSVIITIDMCADSLASMVYMVFLHAVNLHALCNRRRRQWSVATCHVVICGPPVDAYKDEDLIKRSISEMWRLCAITTTNSDHNQIIHTEAYFVCKIIIITKTTTTESGWSCRTWLLSDWY